MDASEQEGTPIAVMGTPAAAGSAEAADATPAAGERIVRLDSLELTYRAPSREKDELKRRFMALRVPVGPGASLRGGVGYVVRAESLGMQGEFFALKRLKVLVGGQAEGDPQAEQLAASFRQEYDAHRLIASTGLVPRLHGWARIGGEPAILMEWVEGVTLREASRLLAGPDGKVPLQVVADIGISVLAALRRIERVGSDLVHRDLSPANIMIRTGERPLQDQVESGIYEICLIDFGSATMETEVGSSFTMAENFWRGATPGYAPPEMLDRESGDAAGLRRSHAIDVYALCSVLYELYAGHVPYDTVSRAEHAIYEMKTTEPPRPIGRRSGDDGALEAAIMGGLAPEQDARPTAEALSAELRSWEEAHGTTRPWDETFGALAEADATAASKTPVSLSPTVLVGLGAASASGEPMSAPGVVRKSFRKRHPRLFAGLAIAAAAVVALVVAGSLTRWFGLLGPAPKESVNDYSWAELSQISQMIAGAEDGNAAQQIEVEYNLVNSEGALDGSQVKDVTLADGEQTSVAVTGFRHDEKSDGSGLAGITFSFSEPVDEQPMSTKKTKVRSWKRTSLRTWLSEDFADELPEELSSAIVEVRKDSLRLTPSDGGGEGEIEGIDDDGNDLWFTPSTVACDDRLWVFSEAEVSGSTDSKPQEEGGSQYELYANTTGNAEFGQSQLNSNTGAFSTASWLRTPAEDDAYGYYIMGSDGFSDQTVGADPTKSLSVVPGFCI